MTTDIESFREHIEALAKDKGFRAEVAQVRAKALLGELTDQIPPYKWKYIANRVVRNLMMATLELESVARAKSVRGNHCSQNITAIVKTVSKDKK